MSNCLFCYQPVTENADFHAKCCKRFFGMSTMPELRLDRQLLSDLANQTVNKRIAVSGVQPKLSVDLEKQREHGRLTIVGLWGRYILKPQHNEFQFMPETEDLTMHLANLFGIRTCEHALIRTSEGNLAYLAKRFDRTDDQKIHIEDFCQLSGFLTEQKYKGSYEKIGKLIHLYCTNKGFDALNYFEVVLFSFLTGNNDMHLKNFSIMHRDNNVIALSPAYDLLNVNLVFPSDPEELGLTLNGRKRKITIRDFETLAKSLRLPEKAVENIYQKFKSNCEQVLDLINASFLPDDWKLRYIEIWDQKSKIFST